jgi:hypothetical protein
MGVLTSLSKAALNLLVTEEHYCCMYWYRLQIKWDYKKPARDDCKEH